MSDPRLTPGTPPEKKRILTVGRILERVLDFLMYLTENIGSIFLAVMTLVIIWQVISRFSPHFNSPWTEEIARILMVWFGMTAAAVGIRKGTHIGIEFIVNAFPKRLQRILAIIVSALTAVFSVFLIVEGYNLARGCWNDQLSATLLPRGIVVYLAVPASAALMLLYSIEAMVKQLLDKDGGEPNV